VPLYTTFAVPGRTDPHPLKQSGVLVVDDESYVRDVAERVLNGAGYTTYTAANGWEAVELLRRDPAAVRVVLLDLLMPGMDGWTTLRLLRELRPGLCVVLMSGQSEEEARGRSCEEQTAGYLAKPYRVDTLIAAVEQAISAGA
jgi:two-component system cell cycle sensor histidine kinase/response regulator CckA